MCIWDLIEEEVERVMLAKKDIKNKDKVHETLTREELEEDMYQVQQDAAIHFNIILG